SRAVAGIRADLAAAPTHSLTLTALELTRRFGSTATQRVSRRSLDRATRLLADAGVHVVEEAGGPALLVRLTLVVPSPRPRVAGDVLGPVPLSTSVSGRRAPRRLSALILCAGLVGGAALGATVVTAAVTSSTGSGTARNHGSSPSGAAAGS